MNVNCVQASAPGKLLLIGEYAVLDGAPALVMAVDRRVKVRLQQASSGTGWLSAVQLGFKRAAMRVEGDVLRCDGADSSVLGLTGRLIPGIMRVLGRSPGEITTMNVEIDSGALFESDRRRLIKLGLGSSAAVCAALAVALTEWFAGTAGPADPRAPASMVAGLSRITGRPCQWHRPGGGVLRWYQRISIHRRIRDLHTGELAKGSTLARNMDPSGCPDHGFCRCVRYLEAG